MTRLQDKMILRAKLSTKGDKRSRRDAYKLSGEIDALTYMYTCTRCGVDTPNTPCPTCGEGAES
jgi:rubrerythrin